ncbi:Coiled-coil domain-containing protein 124-like protein [Diplonema papillatum]|nr:Coiled-coil domain-containing protein 124-like protein [Diplonema papillatum]|eukprot:gene1420-2183_t
MPGKKVPMNRHAAAAAERKAEQASKSSSAKEQAEEDAMWADEKGGKASKAAQKAEKAAEKAREKAAKKEEVNAILREEEASSTSKKGAQEKVTQYQLQQQLAKEAKKNTKKGPSNVVTEEERERTLNLVNQNKLDADVDASNLKSAVDQLEKVAFKGAESEEKHPERRLKAAHIAFEEKMIPQLKADNPGLKRSQLKDMCFKLWQKSPENPMVKEAMNRHNAIMSQED